MQTNHREADNRRIHDLMEGRTWYGPDDLRKLLHRLVDETRYIVTEEAAGLLQREGCARCAQIIRQNLQN